MAEKISVYVDEKLHRTLKSAAVAEGKSLSQFMVDAAVLSLYSPDRKKISSVMDSIRESQEGYYSSKELQEMRKDGRRY